jgi:Na+/proline symporter
VSDIGILSDPASQIEMVLLLGSPGLLLGAILGALLWKRHRFAGTLLGAVAGLVLWLTGWLLVSGFI